MTREEAIIEAGKMGKECFLTESIHVERGEVVLNCFSVRVDEVHATAEPSWEKCFEILRKKDPEAAKQKRVAELKAELAKLEPEGEAA